MRRYRHYQRTQLQRRSKLPAIEAIASLWDEPSYDPPAPWSADGVSEQLFAVTRCCMRLAQHYATLKEEITIKWRYPSLHLRDVYRDFQRSLIALFADIQRISTCVGSLVSRLVKFASELSLQSDHLHRLAITRLENSTVDALDTAQRYVRRSRPSDGRRQLVTVRRDWIVTLPLLRESDIGVAGSAYSEACSPTGLALDSIGRLLEEIGDVLDRQIDLWTRHLNVSWATLSDDRLLTSAEEWAPLTRSKVCGLLDSIRRLQSIPGLPVPSYNPTPR